MLASAPPLRVWSSAVRHARPQAAACCERWAAVAVDDGARLEKKDNELDTRI
jgi:hypothetical protein